LSASPGVTIVQLERRNAVVIGLLAGVLMGWLMGRPFDAPMTNGYASLVKAIPCGDDFDGPGGWQEDTGTPTQPNTSI
jgi:hypothetical protein